MKIRNYCLNLKTSIVKYYINTLPEVYRTVDVPIVIVPDNRIGHFIFNRYATKYNLMDRTYEEFQDVGGTAYFQMDSREPLLIFIKYSHELSLPNILFHEIRHWYQQKYLKAFHISGYKNYVDDVNIKNYNKQKLEVDANKFAKEHCKKLGIRFITEKGTESISSKRSKLKKRK